MQALKPIFYLMILFIVIVFLYYGVPAGAVSGTVVRDSTQVDTRVRGRRGSNILRSHRTTVSIGDGEVIIIEGKKARFDKDRAELRRYFSILRWDHWYRFR